MEKKNRSPKKSKKKKRAENEPQKRKGNSLSFAYFMAALIKMSNLPLKPSIQKVVRARKNNS